MSKADVAAAAAGAAAAERRDARARERERQREARERGADIGVKSNGEDEAMPLPPPMGVGRGVAGNVLAKARAEVAAAANPARAANIYNEPRIISHRAPDSSRSEGQGGGRGGPVRHGPPRSLAAGRANAIGPSPSWWG